MRSMLTTKSAILFDLNPVRALFLILRARIVNPPTLGTFKLDVFTHCGSVLSISRLMGDRQISPRPVLNR